MRQFQCSRWSFIRVHAAASRRWSCACASIAATSSRRFSIRITSCSMLIGAARRVTTSRAMVQSLSMHSPYGRPSGHETCSGSHRVRAVVDVARSYEIDSRLSCQIIRDLSVTASARISVGWAATKAATLDQPTPRETDQISCRRTVSSFDASCEGGAWWSPMPCASRIVNPFITSAKGFEMPRVQTY